MIILYCLLAIVLIFLAILLVRAAMFQPHEELKPSGEKIDLDSDRIVNDMVQMIRCRTVSYNDDSLIDKAEFKKFQDLLPKLYPRVHERCPREFVGVNGMLYHWKGKTADEPVVLMAHYDVVPVEESQWDVEDGMIWGRGTLDTKGTFCGIMEAAEKLIAEGFVPEHDIYFAFSGQEEINGPSCPAIVDLFEERGIRPALVVDEGGAVVENVFPGVTKDLRILSLRQKAGEDMPPCRRCTLLWASWRRQWWMWKIILSRDSSQSR